MCSLENDKHLFLTYNLYNHKLKYCNISIHFFLSLNNLAIDSRYGPIAGQTNRRAEEIYYKDKERESKLFGLLKSKSINQQTSNKQTESK